MKVLPITQPLDAVQWTGDNLDEIDTIAATVPAKGEFSPDERRAIVAQYGLTVFVDYWGIGVPIGHWVTRNASGRVDIHGPESFSKLYQPIGD